MTTIFLKKDRDEAVRRFHPWVFTGAIAHTEGNPADGEVVRIVTKHGDFLALGHYNHGGSIAVRVLCHEERTIDNAFWRERIANALRLRRTLGFVDGGLTDAFRLVHGEGDGLPSLIVDVYGDTAVLQAHSLGMFHARKNIAEAIVSVFEGKVARVYDKSATTLPGPVASLAADGYLVGAPGGGEALENGLRFQVDWVGGQKTGFFLDQRENRHLLANYAGGRRVLNAFSYTGGFSVYALHAGAAEVHSVDVSAKAVEAAVANVALNGLPAERHAAFATDVLTFLKQVENPYDIVVLDPPAYAKTMDKRHNAVQGYKRLNAEGMKQVRPGGLLFTFSCSQVVDRELFQHTIVAAGLEAGRSVRVLHQLSQGPDHPVSLFHPEGSYLKGMVLEIG